MEVFSLKEMKKGWFVGNFEPSIFKTEKVEVAVKEYKAGDYEKEHYHKIAKEITVIISGEVMMNNKKMEKGDIVVLEPFESSDFKAVTDSINVVVKIPGKNNDKYLLEIEEK